MIRNIKRLIYHYFYPHESNNFKAKTLHHSFLAFYIVLLLIFQMFLQMIKWSKPEVLGYATDITVEKLLVLINQKRREHNLPPLNLSPELSESATKKAADMFSKNYWAHVSPNGVTPWDFIISSGYDYVYAGENLAKDFDYSVEVVEAWMNSPTHRANILKPEYTDIGFAVMNGTLNGSETTLVVEHFGSRGNREIAYQKTEKNQLTTGMISEFSGSPIHSQKSFLGFPISSFFSKKISFIVLEFLLVILFLDAFYLLRHKPIRISGHSFAHIIFFAAIIGAISVTGIGVIL